MTVFHLFSIDTLPDSSQEELTQVLCHGKSGRIERIISTGQCSPPGFWYDQPEDEWVTLLSGEADLLIENHLHHLKAGDAVLLPAHQRHRIERTSVTPPCIWLCVFGHYQTDDSLSESSQQKDC